MKNTTAIGLMAEELAADYLVKNGYKIIERNFRNRFCEIDIIAANPEYICLVEVKYRKNNLYGGGIEAINSNKQKRLRNGFEFWLSQADQYDHLQPRIDIIAIDSSGSIELVENAI
jgi:putative endonuclease